MLDFGDLVIFTKVVETESFTKAGTLLGFPKSKISRRISRLEEHLGSQLLHRCTAPSRSLRTALCSSNIACAPGRSARRRARASDASPQSAGRRAHRDPLCAWP